MSCSGCYYFGFRFGTFEKWCKNELCSRELKGKPRKCDNRSAFDIKANDPADIDRPMKIQPTKNARP